MTGAVAILALLVLSTPAHAGLLPVDAATGFQSTAPHAEVRSAEAGLAGASMPPAQFEVIAKLAVGALPSPPTYDPANGYLYVSNRGSGSVTIINGTSRVGSVAVGLDPQRSLFDPANGYLYVPNQGVASSTNTSAPNGTQPTSNISVLDGTALLATIPSGLCPVSGAYDPADGFVYIPEGCSGAVDVIHGTEVVANVSLPGSSCPGSATYDPEDGYVYVVDPCGPYDGAVDVLNGTAVLTQLDVGADPFTPTYDSGTGNLYFPCQSSNGVSIVRNLTVLGLVTVGMNPVSATYDTGNGLIYVPNQGTGAYGVANVSLVNGTTLLTTVNVGSSASSSGAIAVPFTNGTGYVFTTNGGDIVALSGDTVAGTVNVSGDPQGGAYDPENGLAYVTVWATQAVPNGTNPNGSENLTYENNVSILECTLCQTVTLEEQGAPAGASWSATASAPRTLYAEAVNAAAPNGLVLRLVNGTYALHVVAPPGTSFRVTSPGDNYSAATGLLQVGVVPGPPAQTSGGPSVAPWGTVGALLALGAASVLAAVVVQRVRLRRDGEELVRGMRRAISDEDGRPEPPP